MKIARNLSLPDDAVTQTFLAVGRRGSGKTHSASVLAEEMLAAGWRIVVIDPVGVWWGLRSKYEIAILGGEHADADLFPDSGKMVADFLISERVSTILDISEFTESEMVRFVADLGSQFYTKTDRTPVHWFIDEADEFSPQGGQSTGGNIPKSMAALSRLVRRGRARGIGVTLITQRCAVLNKSVSSQTECLLAHQTTGPQDLDAIDGWIKHQGTREERGKIMASLPKLKPGECFAYSPAWLGELKQVNVRKRHSFDSSSTPKPGEKPTKPKSVAEIDLSKLAKLLRPKEEVKQEKLGVNAADQRELARLRKEVAVLAGERDRLKSTALEARDQLASVSRRLLDATIPVPDGVLTGTGASPPRQGVFTKVTPETSATPSGLRDEQVPKLGKAERKILQAYYWIRREAYTKSKIGFYSGYSTKSGNFGNALAKLRSAGFISGDSLTQEGERVAATFAVAKPSGRELREWLRPKLTKAANVILDVIIHAMPAELTTEEIAEASGYSRSSGNFGNALAQLRRVDAIDGLTLNPNLV